MPSTYTVNLGIEKPATGEQSGTWGDTTNINFDILDQAINGAVAITLASAGTSGSPNTLAISDGAVSDGRNKWIEFVDGGDLGATAYVQLTPNDAEKIVFIRNSLSGSRSVILFQGTYDAARDLEVPAGVDMVVKFSGGGATATATDVFTRLRATAIETPSLTATTADINGGTVDGTTIGGATPAAGTFTNLTANTNLTINSTTTVDGILDEDNMASNSATKLATQQSIKAYVDSQVGTVDTLAEILANGNTTGSNNIIVDNGQAITTNTINETTAGSGVTIDSVLLKDDSVNATTLEVTNIKANDGTAAGSIANSTGAVTITSFISNSVDIGGGAIDDTTIGGTTPNSGAFTTLSASGNLTVDTNTLYVDSSTNKVSIGTTSSDGTLHVHTGSAGTITAAAAANDLVIESDNAAGLSLLFDDTSTNSYGVIYWGNETDGNADGRIEYFGSTYVTTGDRQAMLFRSAAAERLRLQGSAVVVNEPGNDTDFRVESDNNANMLFVDASTDRVGIGTGSPQRILTLVNDGSSEQLAFQDSDLGAAGAWWLAGNEGGTFSFKQSMQAAGSLTSLSSALKMKLDDAIIFNEDSRDTDFRVESDTNTHALFVDGAAGHIGLGRTPSAWGTNWLGVQLSAAGQYGGTLSYNGGLVYLGYNAFNNGTNWIYGSNDVASLYSLGGNGSHNWYSAAAGTGGNTISFTNTMTLANTGVLTNQVGAVFNESGADSDFRVESDTNANAIFLDASTGILNIGASSAPSRTPASSIHYASGAHLVSGGFGRIWVPGQNIGSLTYAGLYGMATTYNAYYDAGWKSLGGGTASAITIDEGAFAFSSSNSVGAADAALTWTNRLTISSTGAVQHYGNDSTSFTVNEASADVDFRVESNNNTHMLFVDGGNDRVGVGFSAPDAALDVTTNGLSSGYHNTLFARGGGDYDDSGAIVFIGQAATGNSRGLYMKAGREVGDRALAQFYLNNSGGVVGSSIYEMMRFYASGGGVSGLTTVFNELGDSIDFRIESDTNAFAFFVDASQNGVGIGTSTVNAALSVGGSLRFEVTSPCPILSGVNNNADALFIDTNSAVATTDSILEVANNTLVKFVIEGNGDVLNSTGSYGTISDRNLKENIADANSQWDDIKAVKVRKFSLISDELPEANMLGVIAQELEEAGMGGLVKTKERTGVKTVKYSILYMKAVKALQEAMNRIETLEARIAALETK